MSKLALALAGLLLATPCAGLAQTPPEAPKVPVTVPADAVKLPALSYKVIKSGPATGKSPTRRDVVTVNYELKLLDGTVLDSSYARGEPAQFPLSDLILAWQIVVPMMKPGDEWMIYSPPEYAYGSRAREGLPANSFLTFRMELLSVEPAGAF